MSLNPQHEETRVLTLLEFRHKSGKDLCKHRIKPNPDFCDWNVKAISTDGKVTRAEKLSERELIILGWFLHDCFVYSGGTKNSATSKTKLKSR